MFRSLCTALLSLSALVLRTVALSLSLRPGRAFLSTCAFFAFSPSCGNELLLLLSRHWGSLTLSLSWLRRLRFVVFFHNRFICRIAVILLFRFLFGFCFCCRCCCWLGHVVVAAALRYCCLLHFAIRTRISF